MRTQDLHNSPAQADEFILDARGLLCPEPLRQAAAQAGRLAPGHRLRVLTTDPAAPLDLEAWCRRKGHAWLSCEPLASGHVIRLQLGLAGTGPGPRS